MVRLHLEDAYNKAAQRAAAAAAAAAVGVLLDAGFEAFGVVEPRMFFEETPHS